MKDKIWWRYEPYWEDEFHGIDKSMRLYPKGNARTIGSSSFLGWINREGGEENNGRELGDPKRIPGEYVYKYETMESKPNDYGFANSLGEAKRKLEALL